MAAIAVGAAAAVYAERATMRSGVAALAHTQIGWVIVGIAAECVSMAAFAQLERGLLASGGARLTLRAALATAYDANAIAVAVPIVGSGMATGYVYREFRRHGAAPQQVSIALTVAGIFSTVAFAALAAAGAVLSGNPAAAGVALAGGCAAAVAAGLVRLPLPARTAVASGGPG